MTTLLPQYISTSSRLLSWRFIVIYILASLIVTIVRRRYFSPISTIPGPFVASFTRLWHVFHIFKGKQSHKLMELHDQHGPFVRLAPDEVSVCHPDAPRKLLLSALDKGPFYEIGSMPDWRFQTAFSVREPKEKMRITRSVGPAFAAHHLLKSEDRMDEVMSKLFTAMDKFSDQGKAMHLDHYLAWAAYDVLGELFFSTSFGFLDQGKDIGGTLAAAKNVQALGAMLGYFHWLYLLLANPFVTWLGVLPLGHMYHTTANAVKKRQNNPDARFDGLALWLKVHKENPERLGLYELYGTASTTVQAGAETVSSAMQSFLYHSMRHPETWARMREEIAKEQAQGRCRDPVISYADTQSLPFLQACINESLRVFGPLGMGLQRLVPSKGLTLGDRTFSPGTLLTVQVPAMHLDPALWGPDARSFRPDRWLDDDIEQKKRYFAPFGLGYCACPGQHLAMIEVAKICATIVRDYDIRQVNPNQEWKYSVYFDVCPYDWPVYIQRRNVGASSGN